MSSKKDRLWFWLLHKVFKVPEGNIIPKYLGPVMFLFHPRSCLLRYFERQVYDIQCDCFVFDGIKVSRQLISSMTLGMPKGRWFRTDREGDRVVVSVRTLEESK